MEAAAPPRPHLVLCLSCVPTPRPVGTLGGKEGRHRVLWLSAWDSAPSLPSAKPWLLGWAGTLGGWLAWATVQSSDRVRELPCNQLPICCPRQGLSLSLGQGELLF